MKLILSFIIFVLAHISLGQYTHPTVDIQSEFVGSCLVVDCGPSTYTDNGDIGGNYANNIDFIYRVLSIYFRELYESNL
jgi:hypothetical protein